MCERLKQAVLKTAVLERVPGVRIPLPPPSSLKCRETLRLSLEIAESSRNSTSFARKPDTEKVSRQRSWPDVRPFSKNAFLMLYGAAVAGMLFVWLLILRTHLRFRRALMRERLLLLPIRLRAHPLFTLAGILFIIAIAITTFFVGGLQWSVPAFSVFLVLISLLYLRIRRQGTSGVRGNA
jgi:Amino acid permease